MATTQSATQKPVMTATNVYPCCKGGVRQEVGVLIVSVAFLAIGIAGLTNWDFAGLGKLDFTASVTLTVLGGGAGSYALYLIFRKPPVQQQYNPEKAKNDFFAAFKNGAKGIGYVGTTILNDRIGVSKWVDENGNNALHLCAQNRIVMKDGDSGLGKLDYGVTGQIPQLFKYTDVKYDAVNKDGQTPLHCAVIARSHVAVIYLLEQMKDKKKDLNVQDNLGNTPLHYAYMAFHENDKGEYIIGTKKGPIDSRNKIMDLLMEEPDLNTTTLRNKKGELPRDLQKNSP